MLEVLWNYFGDFDHNEAARIFVLLTFAFGLPLAIGLWCKVVTWSVRQARQCQQYLWAPSAELLESHSCS